MICSIALNVLDSEDHAGNEKVLIFYIFFNNLNWIFIWHTLIGSNGSNKQTKSVHKLIALIFLNI